MCERDKHICLIVRDGNTSTPTRPQYIQIQLTQSHFLKSLIIFVRILSMKLRQSIEITRKFMILMELDLIKV